MPDLSQTISSVYISYKHKTSPTSEISSHLINFLDVCRRCASWFLTTSSICQPGWRGGTSSSWVWLNWRRSTKITKVKHPCDCDSSHSHRELLTHLSLVIVEPAPELTRNMISSHEITADRQLTLQKMCQHISDNEHLCSQSAFVGQLEVTKEEEVFFSKSTVLFSFLSAICCC